MQSENLIVPPAKTNRKDRMFLIVAVVAAVAIWIASTIILSLVLKTTRTIDIVKTNNAPKPIGPYNVAKTYDGIVMLSGQIGLDPRTGTISTDLGQQTKQALKNIESVLEASGSSLNNVLKCTIYLTDMNNFKAVNDIYQTFFQGGMEPARSTVAVKALPMSALVEIEAVAAKND